MGLYAEPGYLLFRRETSLVAQRFDVSRLELEGAPAVVAEGVGASAFSYQVFFSASENGVLAYLEPGPAGSWPGSIGWGGPSEPQAPWPIQQPVPDAGR